MTKRTKALATNQLFIELLRPNTDNYTLSEIREAAKFVMKNWRECADVDNVLRHSKPDIIYFVNFDLVTLQNALASKLFPADRKQEILKELAAIQAKRGKSK